MGSSVGRKQRRAPLFTASRCLSVGGSWVFKRKKVSNSNAVGSQSKSPCRDYHIAMVL